jgi:hypothetical protein
LCHQQRRSNIAVWHDRTFASPEAAAGAAWEEHAAQSTHAVQGVHFAVDRDAAGWFWHPLPASPLCLRLGRASRASTAEAQALSGAIPEPPAIGVHGKSYTYAKACFRFHEAAKRGDREQLRMGRIFGVSTHALLARRYARACLVALNIIQANAHTHEGASHA